MKKFIKFILKTAALAAAGAGVYYAYKKYAENGNSDEEEDFDGDLSEFDLEEDNA